MTPSSRFLEPDLHDDVPSPQAQCDTGPPSSCPGQQHPDRHHAGRVVYQPTNSNDSVIITHDLDSVGGAAVAEAENEDIAKDAGPTFPVGGQAGAASVTPAAER